MNKETFVWLSLGFGIGLLVASGITYYSILEDKRKHREEPRLVKAEALLEEAEDLLKNAKKIK